MQPADMVQTSQAKPRFASPASIAIPVAITLWAACLRVLPMLLFGGPTAYHSGGLFYAFAAAIRSHGFAMPETIPHYTNGGLPFAYPPLAFYLIAALDSIFEQGPVLILYVNVVFSILVVPAFYLLTLALPDFSRAGRVVATLAFATLPLLIAEQLPGEGLAESTGLLVFVLFLRQLLLVKPSSTWISRAGLGVLLGLNVLIAPGTAYAAPVIYVVYVLGRFLKAPKTRHARRRIVLNALLPVAVSLIAASPYLIAVASRYGFGLFLRSFGSEHSHLGSSLIVTLDLFFMPGKGYVFPTLAQMLTLWGVLYAVLARKQFLLFLMLFLVLVPSEGPWLYSVPVGLMAGLAWQGVIVPGLRTVASTVRPDSDVRRVQNLLFTGFLPVLVALAPIFAEIAYDRTTAPFYYAFVTDEELTALQEAQAHSQPDDTFLVFANEIEWFPELTDRTVLNVVYGTEWIPDKYRAIRDFKQQLDDCAAAQELLLILEQNARAYPAYFPLPDYLYISKEAEDLQRGNPVASEALIADLRRDPSFTVAFETPTTIVFAYHAEP